VAVYKFTEYFEKEVLRKRPYLKKEWCIRVLESPLKGESQEGIDIDSGVELMSLRVEF
jgi:hypothetical protein